MKTISGFTVPNNCTEVPDYILCNQDRRVMMNTQITMPYASYLRLKLEDLKIAWNKDIQENWSDRDDNVIARFSLYEKTILAVETSLKSINEARMVEIVKDNNLKREML